MTVRCACILAVVLALPFIRSGAFAQGEIERRQEQLEEIRTEIRVFEEKIGKYGKDEKATLELMDAYDRKTTLVKKLIRNLKSGEQRLQARIDSMKQEISYLEDRLAALKQHYAAYVVSVYKAGSVLDEELLLTSSSVNQAFVRSEYLSRFTSQRKEDAERIIARRAEIEGMQFVLAADLTDQRRLLAEKGAEESRLTGLSNDRQQVLNSIRKDRKALQAELERKVQAARELQGVIEALVEAERSRAEERKGEVVVPPPFPDSAFETRKGKLRWPVDQGKVVARYGNQTHPTLKTVTDNPGIDISVKPGTPVVAIANGRVARIWWLVSYGNLIILDHGGGYRTIYAHLSDIAVTEGQTVAEGSTIATSGETLDGSRLHLEIWKDREKQNPEQWLTKR